MNTMGSIANPYPLSHTLPTAGTIVMVQVIQEATKDKRFVLVQLEGGLTGMPYKFPMFFGCVGLLHESQVRGNTRQERNARLRKFTRNIQCDLYVLDVAKKDGKIRISLSERAVDNWLSVRPKPWVSPHPCSEPRPSSACAKR